MNHTPYVIALYIRLSVEDAKVESLSIENQKYALHQYVESVRMATKKVRMDKWSRTRKPLSISVGK